MREKVWYFEIGHYEGKRFGTLKQDIIREKVWYFETGHYEGKGLVL